MGCCGGKKQEPIEPNEFDMAVEMERLLSENIEMKRVLKDVHSSIDLLFANLILKDDSFLPSQSGLPWKTMLKVNELLRKEPLNHK